MTNETETITNSIDTTVDSMVEEVKTPSVHPAVGVAGVSTIGGFLGALVAGPIGAILGGTLGVFGASIENAKSNKSGYYTTRNRVGSMRSGQPLDALSDVHKELAQDISGVADGIQQGASDLASNAKATIAKVGDNLSDLTASKKGILLDVDGTLVISNDAHAHAWVEAFAAFGYDISFEQVRPLIGMGADQVVPRMASELSSEESIGKQVADRRKELLIHKFGPSLSPAPGSRDLILRLKQEGFQLVVASSATSEELSVLLKAAQVDDLLEEEPTTTSDDADTSKPAPDLVQSALKKGKLDANQAIMLGDTPYDIQAANAAGVNVIAVRCGEFDDSQFSGALAIYDNPADLLAQFERSPLKQLQTTSIES